MVEFPSPFSVEGGGFGSQLFRILESAYGPSGARMAYLLLCSVLVARFCRICYFCSVLRMAPPSQHDGLCPRCTQARARILFFAHVDMCFKATALCYVLFFLFVPPPPPSPPSPPKLVVLLCKEFHRSILATHVRLAAFTRVSLRCHFVQL